MKGKNDNNKFKIFETIFTKQIKQKNFQFIEYENKFYDILIIGAGAAGTAATWNLSGNGFKILCVDQGPKINPKSIHLINLIGKKLN